MAARKKSATMKAVVYLLVDDEGQVTAGENQGELWSVHEAKGGYSGLQLYELTITLPRPLSCIELTAALSPSKTRSEAPVSISVRRKEAEAP